LDIKKAFDIVNLDILLEKFNHYGIRGINANMLLESSLKGRKHFEFTHDSKPKPLNVSRGIPQGSNLGPLLFKYTITLMIILMPSQVFLIICCRRLYLLSCQ